MREEVRSLDALTAHCAVSPQWIERIETSDPALQAVRLAHDVQTDPEDDPLEEYNTQVDAVVHSANHARNERMKTATAWLHRHGMSTEITPDAVNAWMNMVLEKSTHTDLRSTVAYSRGGRLVHSELASEQWTQSLMQWTSTSCSPYIAAAGLYLDTIFFHPFNDGNARLARGLLLWHLRRSRVALPSLAMIIALPKRPGNVDDYLRFVRVCALAVCQRQRRRVHTRMCHTNGHTEGES